MVLKIPSFVMVFIGFRVQELHQQTFVGLVFLDLMTKIAFGFVLIPLVYLIGFFQRNNAENIYKGLGLILYLVGHFPNMLLLSILNFWSGDGVRCNSGNEAILLFICMVNPFTYNFFNPVLQYYICDE